MQKLSKTLIYGGAGLCVPALLLIVVLFVDFHSAPTKQITGEVVGHKFTPGKTIPVTDPPECSKEEGFEDCIYIQQESESIYSLIVAWRRWADVMAVPRSYFYSSSKKDRIPIAIKEGPITGWIYDVQIQFPTKESL